ncbi:MAG TPA: DUF4252 domain-containing protein [Acidobacteriaceae bacterium]|jgi:hypothetical protein|nr:DUF4252 domain-containing protein [Acidobacteriaceae bacterium]
MKMMSGWMRAGMVAAMMVAAAAAGAQTTADDAAKAADAQAKGAAQQAEVQAQAAKIEADVQAQAAAQQADVQAQVAAQVEKVKADFARQQATLAPLAAQLAVQTKLSVQENAEVQAQVERVQAEAARMEVRMAPIKVKLALQAEQMAPLEAKLEMSMVPLQAAMMARAAAMQAHMMARGLVMQDGGMVSVGDPQVKDELFDGTEKFAKGASDVTSVNLGPDMLGMVSGKHGGDMARKLNFMVVRTYEYPRPGMYNMADVDAYRQKLKTGNWNCFIHTSESKTGESTDICNRALPNGEGNEMVILTVEPKELTFIHMSGKGSLADLGKMGKMGGFGGEIPTPPEPPSPPSPPNQ